MEEALIRHIAKTAFKTSSTLGDLVPLLKANLGSNNEECIKFSKLIATAMAEIYFTLLDPIYKEFPHIKEEFDASIQKYGTLL